MGTRSVCAIFLTVLVIAASGKHLEFEEQPVRGRVKRQATGGGGQTSATAYGDYECLPGFPSDSSTSYVNKSGPPTYRYPFGKAKLIRARRRLTNGLPAPPQSIRLRGEVDDINPNEGRVEILSGGRYGMLCDGYWSEDDADVACKQLGFVEGAFQWPRGSKFGKSRILSARDILMGEIRCRGTESRIQDCSHKPIPICERSKTAGVVCWANEGCPFGWSASNGMCYRVVEEKKTYEDATKACKKLGAKLLYILSPEDNNYISDIVSLKWPKVKALWTGAQWREMTSVRGRRYGAWVWGNGYQTVSSKMQDLFFPGFYKWRKGRRPTPDFREKPCVAMSRIYLDTARRNQTTDVNYFWWDNISCKQKIAFVCQRPYFEHGYKTKNCYNDRGVDYRGNVTRTERGSICEKWTAKGAQVNPSNTPNKGLGDHNYCRNPDNDVKPWCWVNASKGTYGYCNTYRCDLMPTASTPLFTRKVGPFGYGNGGCKKNEFFCPSMYRYKLQCLKKDQVCDGERNCVDSEDENDDFCKNFACKENEFFCNRDKYCIPNERRCDGARDCSDGADERGCAPKESQMPLFSCTQKSHLNIKKLVYQTKTAELCAAKCDESAERLGIVCASFNFLKADGKTRWYAECQLMAKTLEGSGKKLQTNPLSTFCQFKKDCGNDKMFACKNGRCIAKKYKCNGLDDCGDRSDEAGCKPPDASAGTNMPFKVRLAGSKNKYSGRVEVRYKGEWGLICDDNFDIDDATVVCKELGFKGASKALRNSQLQFGLGNGNFLMDEVKCTGTERTIAKCPFDGWKKSDCAANEVAGVICDVNRACEPNEFRCEDDNQCIDNTKICDGKKDCKDGSDEESCKVELRLTDGPSKNEGRVVVRRNYIKGTICDDQFDDNDAQVICRQLGFKGSAKAILNGKYGGGKGMIWLSDLKCKGDEAKLVDCPDLKWASSKCDHKEDVGVACNVKKDEKQDGSKKPGKEDILKMPWSKILNLTIPCGERPGAARRRGRVINGYPATPGLIPWQAGVRKYTSNMKYQGHHCGGTIISEYWVVTAAHCYKNNVPKNMYVIRVGDLNNVKTDVGEQVFEIDQMITHPNWTGPPQYDFDLTLFKLKPVNGKGIQFNKNVQPACMPTKKTIVDQSNNCFVSGWGSLGGFNYPKILQVADVPMIPWSRCKELYKDGFTRRMQCAGFEAGGIDTCQGDSGGPLVCKVDGKFTAWGQCSWGNGCALPNNPGVYARVQEFLDWIKLTVSKN